MACPLIICPHFTTHRVEQHGDRRRSREVHLQLGHQHGHVFGEDVVPPQEPFYSVSAISPSARTYSNYVEPRNYQHSQTFADAEQWEAATQSELQSFIDMGVIDPCNYHELPVNMRRT